MRKVSLDFKRKGTYPLFTSYSNINTQCTENIRNYERSNPEAVIKPNNGKLTTDMSTQHIFLGRGWMQQPAGMVCSNYFRPYTMSMPPAVF